MRSHWKGPYFSLSFYRFDTNFFKSRFHIPPFLNSKRIEVYNGKKYESFIVRTNWPDYFKFYDFLTTKKTGPKIHKKVSRRKLKMMKIYLLWHNQQILKHCDLA